jgi:dihydroorotate dehydrogenase
LFFFVCCSILVLLYLEEEGTYLLNLYPKKLLFSLSPEIAHRFSLAVGKHVPSLLSSKINTPPVNCCGLTFPNPVGLAAGVDKDAYCVDAWLKMGFGFVEVGTVTLRPQPGHPKPRLFRLQDDMALINRFGFNSAGADVVAKRLSKRKRAGIVGVNIGKNADVMNEHAAGNYLACFNKVAPYADFVTINISSPNTEGLRSLHDVHPLTHLLDVICEARDVLQQRQQRKLPLWLKVSPDLSPLQLLDFCQVVSDYSVDAIVSTNTTVKRNFLKNANQFQHGGLSGEPLRELSDSLIKQCRQHLPHTPIIGVGGIMSADDAMTKFALGAKLVQLYTGLVYKGPRLLNDIKSAYSDLHI